MLNRIAVSTTEASLAEKAKALAHQVHLPFEADHTLKNTYDYLLLLTPDYLGLLCTREKKATPFYLDFASPKLTYRRKQASLRKEMLARAMGIHPKEKPIIIDATAGLGRDSFILASLGYDVTLIEQSPIVHALLEDALLRGSQHPEIAPILTRMQLVCANSIDYLNQHAKAEVIYLDPMFPERKKSASVKKEMVLLQDLIQEADNEERLFAAALACAKRRVVVKRPRIAANIGKHAPNFSMTGKSSRFDIYLK